MSLSWRQSVRVLFALALYILAGGRLKSWPVASLRPGGPERTLFEMDNEQAEQDWKRIVERSERRRLWRDLHQ